MHIQYIYVKCLGELGLVVCKQYINPSPTQSNKVNVQPFPGQQHLCYKDIFSSPDNEIENPQLLPCPTTL